MDRQQLKQLIVQSLEHERGGVEVYETALEVAVNDDLRKEWTEYLRANQAPRTDLGKRL